MRRETNTRNKSRKTLNRQAGEYGVPEAPPSNQRRDPRAGLHEDWNQRSENPNERSSYAADESLSDRAAPWMRSRIDEGRYYDKYNRPEYPYPRNDRFSSQRSNHEESFIDSVKNFFGKGPKGYRRSDERIYEDICETLYRHPEIDASDVEVSVKDGLVTLKGTVEDRWTKRMIEDVADDCTGVNDIANQIQIRESAPYPERELQVSKKSSRARAVQ